MKGNVKFFNDMKGFGFIMATNGKEYFVHQTGIQDGVIIRDNDSVEFDIEEGERGPKAVNVRKGDDEESSDDAQEETQEEESEDN